ncbi:unnamed protein product [marine sediment metagenome]|uniref:Uncharacterized protein n=1 Tax=marine sediment metagenome TaxID=412755 RepID=X0UT33_9ZZZZ
MIKAKYIFGDTPPAEQKAEIIDEEALNRKIIVAVGGKTGSGRHHTLHPRIGWIIKGAQKNRAD